MCWSFWASAFFAMVGVLAVGYMVRKKWEYRLWVPLLYFTIMEVLQVLTYPHINACDLPVNQLLTFFGYIHISFQPFFINMFMMHFIPKRVAARIQGYVYALCFFGTVALLTMLYPFSWAGTCSWGALCSTNLCSVSGNWHLAWNIPLNGFHYLWIVGYALPAFLLPFLYGAWRISIYHILIGPVIARLLTSNLNEWPAVWCLISVAYILLVFTPKLRKLLYTKKWYLWKYP